MNKDFDLIVKLYKGEIQDLNLYSAYRVDINTLENMLEDEYNKGVNKGLADCESKISNNLRNKTIQMILQGLESYGNNGVNQGKLTTSQIRLFFKEHYGIELN